MRILFMLLLTTTVLGASAQKINGFAKDSDGNPVMGATVSLLADTGSAVIKLAVTEENGSFGFSEVMPGNYRVGISHVSYEPSVSGIFSLASEDITVPDLILNRLAANLQNVVVTTRKPIIEVKADKTILNVEGTINAVGSDALELLRKSPGVTVDKDDNLSLSGKNGVQVHIDGRPTPLAGQDLANYLKTLQSSNIEAIELITNPSAKYEAAGNAGIINIRLKKNKTIGTNGSVNAGFNYGIFAKYNTGINLNYRNQKMNIFGNYNFNKGLNRNKMNIHRTIGDTLFEQSAIMDISNQSHSYKAGVDFFLNKQNTLGVLVNGTIADPSISNYSRTPIIYLPTGTTDRILVADNESRMERDNININLNYMYNGKDGKSLVVNADHGIFDINSNQFQPNTYYDPTGQTVLSNITYRMIAPGEINISSFKADYEQNFMKGKLGFGGKIAFVKSDNDFQRYDVIGSDESIDKDRSNHFIYDENINAGYVNYNRAFEGVMIQAGLRVENTVSEGISTGQKLVGGVYTGYDSSFKRNYTNLFPSAAVTFNKNPMSQWSVTYSRRIDRPAYQDLNPFEFKLDEYTFQKGNINIRPQYTNSFGLTHTYKFKLNTTLNYSHVKDLFTQIIDTAETSKAFITKKNLATQDIVSLNVSYPFMYKNYTLFTNINSNYSRYKADFGDGRKIDLDAVGFSIYAQNSLKFAKTWTAELSTFYNSPTIYMGSFKGKSLASVDLGIQKQIFNGKATIKASYSDLLGTLKFRGSTDFAGQRSVFTSNWEARQFKLNFVFRFGSNKVKAARQRSGGAEDETKRVQQGGSGISIGQ